MKIVRIIQSLVIFNNYRMFQLNVKKIFLNEDVEEQIFMFTPSRYEEARKCCKLKKSLYELK